MSFLVIRRTLIMLAVIVPAGLNVGCNNSRQWKQSPGVRGQTGSAMSDSSPVSASDAAAIRTAIETHLRDRAGLDMSMMDMNIDTIQISGEQARAKASFIFNQGGGLMAMNYMLSRSGKGWEVTSSQPADGSFTHPPMDPAHSSEAPQASDASPASDFTDFINSHAAANKK